MREIWNNVIRRKLIDLIILWANGVLGQFDMVSGFFFGMKMPKLQLFLIYGFSLFDFKDFFWFG